MLPVDQFRRLFGDPAKSGGDWIRMGCQNATMVTPACRVGDPDCQTCEVAAEYDRLEYAAMQAQRACNAHDELVAALKAIVYRTPAGNALFHKLTEEHAEAALAALTKAESTP